MSSNALGPAAGSRPWIPPGRIISGGQSGADRAALEAAVQLGIPTGGWCPAGWRTDNGPAPELVTQFGLKETAFPYYKTRTILNVRESEATVWFGKCDSPGARLTLGLARGYARPRLINPDPATLRAWLAENRFRVLNVAGNSERTNPGIGARVKAILLEALGGPPNGASGYNRFQNLDPSRFVPRHGANREVQRKARFAE